MENLVRDIDFDADKVRHGVDAIVRLLERKTAVTVLAVHNYGGFGVTPSGEITHPWTHFLTIVGCSDLLDGNTRTFLVVDPWPTGSIMTYNSGIMGDVHSMFMGYIYYRPNEHRIATASINEERVIINGRDVHSYPGNHSYVVLTGPV